MEKNGKRLSGNFQMMDFSRIKTVFFIIFFAAQISTCAAIRDMAGYKDPLSAEEHNRLGVIYEEKKEWDSAIKEYNKAAAIKNGWFLPYFNLGNVYYKKGDFTRSEENFKKSIILESSCSDCLNNYAYLLYENKRYNEALKYIEQALLIQKKNEYLDTLNKIRGTLR